MVLLDTVRLVRTRRINIMPRLDLAGVRLLTCVFLSVIDGLAVFLSFWAAIFLLCSSYGLFLIAGLFGKNQSAEESVESHSEVQSCDSTESTETVDNSEAEDTDDAPEVVEIVKVTKRVRFEDEVKLEETESEQSLNKETSYESKVSERRSRNIEKEVPRKQGMEELGIKDVSNLDNPEIENEKNEEVHQEEIFDQNKSTQSSQLHERGNSTEEMKPQQEIKNVMKQNIQAQSTVEPIVAPGAKEIITPVKDTGLELKIDTLGGKDLVQQSPKIEGLKTEQRNKYEQELNIKKEKDDFSTIKVEFNIAAEMTENSAETINVSEPKETTSGVKALNLPKVIDTGKVPKSQEAADGGKVPKSQEAADGGKVPKSQELSDDSNVQKPYEVADSGKVPKSQDHSAGASDTQLKRIEPKGEKMKPVETLSSIESDKKSQKSKSVVKRGKK